MQTLPLATARRAPAPDFQRVLDAHGRGKLRRGAVTTLQINVGRVCNQACHHCHVDAGPTRTESMSPAVAARVIDLLAASPQVTTLDITGGAPELCPSFRWLVTEARKLSRHVIDRCNLTILFEPGHEDLARFLADHEVAIVASLPCYLAENVDGQRGKGVFEKSIAALQTLNALGYGLAGSGRTLDLVYNPTGPSLPPAQGPLEERYKRELEARYGIAFNRLLTITNLPIARFADYLRVTGQDEAYMGLLVNHFNPQTVDGLMCRSLVSVGWEGELFDCDFNQMLSMPLGGRRQTIFDLERLDALEGDAIATASHCFGCTAGSGSSCGGALA